MAARGEKLVAFLQRAARSAAARTGNAERFGELEAVFTPAQRRELRDNLAARAVLVATLRSGSTAVDVGANVGDVLQDIVRLAPDGRHLAFEPVPDLHEELVRRFPGVDVRRAALSDVEGTLEFTHVVGAPAYSGLRRRADLPPEAGELRRISVATHRLDDLLDPELSPALIKVDVEGAEVLALRGARETLRRHRPVVLFEHGVGGADLYDTTSAELWDLLDEASLRVFDLEGEGPLTRTEFSARFTAPTWNYVAVPG